MTIGAQIALSVSLLAALASPPARAQRTQTATGTTGDLRAERTMGSPDAPMTMYIISDFECPFCGDFARRIFPALQREYVASGKMKVIYVNMPLSNIHPNAEPAAEAAMCAASQNRFWPMHDLLFKYQDKWVDLRDPTPFFAGLADSIGANGAALAECLRTGAMRALVHADYEGAIRSGAKATPSFYVEGGIIEGDQPLAVFQPILDSIYRARTTPDRNRRRPGAVSAPPAGSRPDTNAAAPKRRPTG